ncbi:MAG: hypothetical protein IT258_15885, partial [Saprospiraceae bacterium]|nr:hypothetical protein [Saprospiraceae bacterium]
EAEEERRKRRGLWWFYGELGLLLLIVLFLNANNHSKLDKQALQDSRVTTSSSINDKPLSINDEEVKTKSEAIENTSKAETLSNASSNSKLEKTGSITQFNKHSKQAIAANGFGKTVNFPTKIKDKKTGSNNASGNTKEGIFGTKTADKSLNPNDIELIAQKESNLVSGNKTATDSASSLNLASRVLNLENIAILRPHLISISEEKTLATEVQKIIPVHTQRLRYGLAASQLLYPQSKSGQAKLIGQRAGIFIRYDLNNGFYLGSGLQYQRRVGTFGPSKEATARNYRFGLELDTLALRPNSLHYAGVPLVLGWIHRRHELEAGLQLDYLMGVWGEVGSYQRKGEPAVRRFVAKDAGWLEKTGYRNFTPTAQLTYRYNLAGRWSIGVSANYILGGVFDPGFDKPTSKYLLQETGNFHLGLQAIYLLR